MQGLTEPFEQVYACSCNITLPGNAARFLIAYQVH